MPRKETGKVPVIWRRRAENPVSKAVEELRSGQYRQIKLASRHHGQNNRHCEERSTHCRHRFAGTGMGIEQVHLRHRSRSDWGPGTFGWDHNGPIAAES